MLYNEGLSDRFGSPVPLYPYLYKHRQSWAVGFNPDYQFLTGDEVEEWKARESNVGRADLETLKAKVIAVLPRLSKRKQKILSLLLIDRNSITDIAAVLNCSYANIYSHLYGDTRYTRSGAVAQLRNIFNPRKEKNKSEK